MMIIDLPSGKIGITFKHRRFDKPRYDENVCKHALNGVTYCEVYAITSTGDAVLTVEGRGLAKCPDPYCKREGRKRSLSSALAKTRPGPKPNERIRMFTKAERQVIWDIYWTTVEPQPSPAPERSILGPVVVDTQGNSITGP